MAVEKAQIAVWHHRRWWMNKFSWFRRQDMTNEGSRSAYRGGLSTTKVIDFSQKSPKSVIDSQQHYEYHKLSWFPRQYPKLCLSGLLHRAPDIVFSDLGPFPGFGHFSWTNFEFFRVFRPWSVAINPSKGFVNLWRVRWGERNLAIWPHTFGLEKYYVQRTLTRVSWGRSDWRDFGWNVTTWVITLKLNFA